MFNGLLCFIKAAMAPQRQHWRAGGGDSDHCSGGNDNDDDDDGDNSDYNDSNIENDNGWDNNNNVALYLNDNNGDVVNNDSNGTVAAICTSTSRLLLATADIKNIRMWDPQPCAEVATLLHERQCSISSLSFSSDGTKVLSLSSGGLFLWMAMNGDWSDARLAFHTLAGCEKVHFPLFDADQIILSVGAGDMSNFGQKGI